MKVRQKVFDSYWKFAAERQEIFFKKLKGLRPPYTSDPILTTYKFCNAYRASDRVSQFLIRKVIYSKERFSGSDILLRVFLFRLLNRVQTWKSLEAELGQISLKNFSFPKYSRVLSKLKTSGPIYGNAFILCANKTFGFEVKHKNHLALLEKVFRKERLDKKLLRSKTLKELFMNLRELPLIGNFMAYQLAIDFNYSPFFDFDENDFTFAGPGAARGIRKCFINPSEKDFSSIICHMVDKQNEEFNRLGIKFKGLWGRPLHAIDCQGLFCETDKYCRIKFPKLKSARTKIKSRYVPTPEKIVYFYPPKWKLQSSHLGGDIASHLGS